MSQIFLRRGNYQGKIPSKSTIFALVWTVMPSHSRTYLELAEGSFGWSGGGMATLDQ